VSEPDPAGEEPYELPGTEPANEPGTRPDGPLTAEKAEPLIPKIIALPHHLNHGAASP
jgi:hypothetical protein